MASGYLIANAGADMSRSRCCARRLALLVMLLSICLIGCRRTVQTDYGSRRPAGSVNGTELLGQLFTLAGHRVSSWPWLSPRLANNADCIVWFAKGYDVPSKEVKRWLEDWLRKVPGRTLIFVSRDYDAAPHYWAATRKTTSGEEYKEFSRELADAQTKHRADLAAADEQADAGWFKLDRSLQARKANSLQGVPRWLAGIDTGQVDIELESRLTPVSRAQVLLGSPQDAIVSRLPVRNSQIILVTNGSFLLNLPLVNRQHCKLAAHLVDEIGSPPQKVVFLDSVAEMPPIHDEDPSSSVKLLRYFGLEPLNLILLHIALLGTVFLFRRVPIFGLARTAAEKSTTDFGQHIEAVGDLLEQTGDADFAKSRIAYYESLKQWGIAGSESVQPPWHAPIAEKQPP